MQDLDNLLSQAIKEANLASNLQELNAVKVKYLGKKGALTLILRETGKLQPSERPKFGQAVNTAKAKLDEVLILKTTDLENALIQEKLESSKIDPTLSGVGQTVGGLHPVTKTIRRMRSFFEGCGFTFVEGPEIEDDYHNFEALNIPSHHPARSMHDTFYFADGRLLRTHTSNVQIRNMVSSEPPFRLMSAGRVYRCDSDLTHTPMFHQFEGMMVDENISIANLKKMLSSFLQNFFEADLDTRFRASYFPFTEPSMEVDMQCFKCKGEGCRICSHTGWVEVLGCGMIHPNVLENCNIDSEKYTGFAFGIGIDRLTMLRYGIPDLRMMFENDLRFLQQF